MTSARVAEIRTDNAFPPLWNVPSMAEWQSRHHRRLPIWRRLPFLAASQSNDCAQPSPAFEASAGKGEGE
jgi:hypothetical protein